MYVITVTLLLVVFYCSSFPSTKIISRADKTITSRETIYHSTSRFGLKISAKNLTKHIFDKYYDGKIPVVIKDVFDFDRKAWVDRLLSSLGDYMIEYDQRLCGDGTNDNDYELNRFEATLSDFVDCVNDNSDHYDNIYMMDEAMLSHDQELLKTCDLSSSHLFKGCDDASDTPFDLFSYFPSKIRPSMALIIGTSNNGCDDMI